VAGDAGNGCYRVEEGLVSRTATTDADRGRPSMIASSPTMAPAPRIAKMRSTPARDIIVTLTKLKFLSRAAFDEFAKQHAEVYKNLVKVLATRLRLIPILNKADSLKIPKSAAT